MDRELIKMRTVFVTGASRGIGRAIARKYASEGYNLALCSLNGGERLEETARECRRLQAEFYERTALDSAGGLEATGTEAGGFGGKASGAEAGDFCGEAMGTEAGGFKADRTCGVLTLTGDVGDPEFVREAFTRIRTELGSVGILINNAGISYIGLVQDMSPADWQRILATNLSSVQYCCSEAIPDMLAAGGGRIINISSVWGRVGASCEAAYSATKGGMDAYTRALARELAPSNISVNALACGCIDTDMNRCFGEEERKALCEEIPAGRFAAPEEVAEAVFTLSCMPGYMTGQVIGFDGGWT